LEDTLENSPSFPSQSSVQSFYYTNGSPSMLNMAFRTPEGKEFVRMMNVVVTNYKNVTSNETVHFSEPTPSLTALESRIPLVNPNTTEYQSYLKL